MNWERKLATVKSFEADVLSVIPPSERWPIRSDEELPLETSASKLLVAIVRYQLSW